MGRGRGAARDAAIEVDGCSAVGDGRSGLYLGRVEESPVEVVEVEFWKVQARQLCF